ncbi:hypothetical protein N7527_010490 [Penicillium freii]|nr:hypothetical protein N7527_010490 [Penicillium freii]
MSVIADLDEAGCYLDMNDSPGEYFRTIRSTPYHDLFLLTEKSLKASKKKAFEAICLIGQFNHGSDIERRVSASAER